MVVKSIIKKVKCKYCGQEIDEGSVFCGYCGKKQPVGRYCVKCGREIGLNDSFCGYCGASRNINDDTCDVSNKNGTKLESQTSTRTPKEEKANKLTIEQAEKNGTVSGISVKKDNERPANDKTLSSLKIRPEIRKWIFIVIAIVLFLGGGVYLLTNNSANEKHLLSKKESKEVIVGKRIRSDALPSIVPSICQAGAPCISVCLQVSSVVLPLPC